VLTLDIDVVGFFFRGPLAYDPPAQLEGFLHAGPPPIYIGFGSIVLENVERTISILLEAIEMTGVRAIISGGWSGLHGQDTPNIHYIRDCPHEWLFKHVAAVVHHGGAGTTACGLRNGKPTTIIPFFGEYVLLPLLRFSRANRRRLFSQPFWGNMVAAAGAGLDPIPYKSLTPQKLADAISYCLTPHAVNIAQAIADRIKQESGVRAAVYSFHQHLPQKKMQCDLIPGKVAVWKLKKGKRVLKLSSTAALTLKIQGRFQKKHLRR
jgi:UDP:flavonoid glycosyltransferase YjiC (YdhE family)